MSVCSRICEQAFLRLILYPLHIALGPSSALLMHIFSGVAGVYVFRFWHMKQTDCAPAQSIPFVNRFHLIPCLPCDHSLAFQCTWTDVCVGVVVAVERCATGNFTGAVGVGVV